MQAAAEEAGKEDGDGYENDHAAGREIQSVSGRQARDAATGAYQYRQRQLASKVAGPNRRGRRRHDEQRLPSDSPSLLKRFGGHVTCSNGTKWCHAVCMWLHVVSCGNGMTGDTSVVF